VSLNPARYMSAMFCVVLNSPTMGQTPFQEPYKISKIIYIFRTNSESEKPQRISDNRRRRCLEMGVLNHLTKVTEEAEKDLASRCSFQGLIVMSPSTHLKVHVFCYWICDLIYHKNITITWHMPKIHIPQQISCKQNFLLSSLWDCEWKFLVRMTLPLFQ
jgi:hypothetical protein